MTAPSDNASIVELIDTMAEHLGKLIASRDQAQWRLIGIHTGGVWIAERLQERLSLPDPPGQLNIAFYRDDFSRIGLHPRVQPSKLPFDVDGRHVILVDDILYTGRTIRAALNEIFDFGRPASVVLAVLADRNGRELPIQADVVGMRLSLSATEHVKLCGPEPLELVYSSKT
jgi:pyrimidine operon attenuation protein/uracil phosphoribosyltransferase